MCEWLQADMCMLFSVMDLENEETAGVEKAEDLEDKELIGEKIEEVLNWGEEQTIYRLIFFSTSI